MSKDINLKQKVVVLTTGGTIEKTYDENEGTLENRGSSIRERVFSKFRLPYTDVEFFSIMSKDSDHMTDADRDYILTTIKHHLHKNCPIVVLHGTDTMEFTARHCFENLLDVTHPIVFTGAMRPFGLENSDAIQNILEALLASKIISPGIYVSFHNRIFDVPNVRKNREKRTFEAIKA